MATRTILFEVNEIPLRVIDDYARRYPKSSLAHLLERSKQFETVCEDQITLDPWISWPTLHRGVIDKQHKLLHLGQSVNDADASFPPIWQLLTRNGFKVGVMGSLHTSEAPPDVERYAFYVPDVFSDKEFAHPASMLAFQRFNLAMTRRSSRNVDKRIASWEALRFAAEYPFRGMSRTTVTRIAEVLVNEKRRPHLKARRRAVQPLITLDLFLHQFKKSLPDFATLHTNHVAAAMHRYWGAAYPNDLSTNEMPPAWRDKYAGEVEYAMGVLDVMLASLLKLASHTSSRLVLATSLGQAAIPSKPTTGLITLARPQAMMNRLGVAVADWSERFAMSPQTSIFVAPHAADAFEKKLKELTIGRDKMVCNAFAVPPMSYDRNGSSFQLMFGLDSYDGPQIARVGTEEIAFSDLGLAFRPHEDGVDCSAQHTPYGSMLVYDPAQQKVVHGRSRISTLDVAPALLDAYGLTPPSYMHAADRSILDVGRNTVSRDFGEGGVMRPIQPAGAGARASTYESAIHVRAASTEAVS